MQEANSFLLALSATTFTQYSDQLDAIVRLRDAVTHMLRYDARDFVSSSGLSYGGSAAVRPATSGDALAVTPLSPRDDGDARLTPGRGGECGGPLNCVVSGKW